MPQLSNWTETLDELEQFSDTITVNNDTATITFTNAHVTLQRNGHVDTGMPLHTLTIDEDPDTITIDTTENELHITTPTASYVFRNPR